MWATILAAALSVQSPIESKFDSDAQWDDLRALSGEAVGPRSAREERATARAWLIKAWHGRRWSLSYYKSEYPLGSLLLGIVVISLLIPLFN